MEGGDPKPEMGRHRDGADAEKGTFLRRHPKRGPAPEQIQLHRRRGGEGGTVCGALAAVPQVKQRRSMAANSEGLSRTPLPCSRSAIQLATN